MTSTTNRPLDPEMNPEEYQAVLDGHVFGIVDNPETDLPAITGELLGADIAVDGIHLYCCTAGAEAFDPTGSRHGIWARVSRVVQSLVYEDQLQTIERELEAGHALVGVDADDGNADQIADILRAHGGHDIVHYGNLTWRKLSATTHPAPTER